MTANAGEAVVRVAARGDGVTESGRYVSGAAPGDRLLADGGLIFGPHHQSPPCQHFSLCGGCQLQHLDETALADFVRGRVVDALSGQALEAESVMPVYLSPPASRRRVALRAGWAGKKFQLGFSSEKSHRIIDLHQCDVMAPSLYALLGPLRQFLANLIAPRERVNIKLAQTEQGIDLLIENWRAEGLSVHQALTDFAGMHTLARLSVDDGYGPVPYWEPEPVTVRLGGNSVSYPPFAFLQATQDGEAALCNAVGDIAADARMVADLFSGLGTFTLNVCKGRKVYAAEAERNSILALKSVASAQQLPIVADHRDLFRRPLSAAEAGKFDAIILDPPRAGAREQVAQLAGSACKTVAYVSCNPASFARDAKTLVTGGYQLRRIWPVGQFRWSTHVELAAEFVRH